MIGYSGADREVIKLIKDSGRGIKTLTIVDRSGEGAMAVRTRLAEEHGLEFESSDPVDRDFDLWIASGGLRRFVEEMSARPF